MRQASPLLRRLGRRQLLDFSDYLELRHAIDAGDDSAELRAATRALAERLPVRFADAIPDLHTLADAPAPPPRGLTREALRVVFAMREEFATHGRARGAMMGFDLPDGDGLKDWLDFMEAERKAAREVRAQLRRLDRKIWALYTGERT